MLEAGAKLGGRYEIIKKIGAGGMADVYMAKDNKLGRFVAIKVLKEEFSSDENFLRKFDIEAQAVAGLLHPNIINVYDVGIEGDVHYIVMELADGITLKEYIRNEKRLTAEDTVNFSIQIAEAIGCAHEHKIIHRDIKPQNILVSSYGAIKVTDFGIAKAANSNTMTSTAIGSVHYLSPEQARGGFSDSRSDIYALGITMYEMVTGRVPFDHENGVTIALMHLQNDAIPPREINSNIPKSLEKIILKCLAKKPEERYQTAGELIVDLKKVFEDPEGSFVKMPVFVDDSPTQLIGDAEISQIKSQIADRSIEKSELSNTEIKKQKASKQEEGMVDGDEEEDIAVSGKLEKLVVILAIVVAVIIAIGIFSFIGKASGLFKVGKNNVTTENTANVAGDTSTEEYKTTTVPDLYKLTAEAAEEKLDAEKLKCQIEYEESDEVQLGCVIRQNIEAGREVEEGTTVIITVNSGEVKKSVPQVTGQTQAAATKILRNIPFRVSVQEKYSDEVAEGIVISQSPDAGKKAAKNSTVTIVVSKGSSKVTVPSLTNYTQSEASRQLRNMGLVLGNVASEYNDDVKKGYVIRQGVAAGTKVSKGTAISIVISLGPKATEEPTTTEEEHEPDTEEEEDYE
ncbi:MAG: Stk1 family PASTA domain-containing Ser/Thr kinase [Candidatus Fimousia sp.]|nr:Stk1 family PASTA domain-containing Ser/Thr kinase [Anaerostipes sp.]